jgi:hypothetical protein
VAAAFFPHDEPLGVSASAYSRELDREMVWLVGQVPYEQASQIARRIGGWPVTVGTLWNHSQQQGERLALAAEEQQQQVGLERTRWEDERYRPQTRKVVSLDGGMVYVRGEGWKELKVGLVAEISSQATVRTRPADPEGGVHLTAMRYCGVVGEVNPFEQALWALAVENDLSYAGLVVVIADGAPWIWRLAADYFPGAKQVIDWFHACQHLGQAAQARYPTDTLVAQRWLEELKTLLFKGEIHKILALFDHYGLAGHGDYFVEHQRRMQYAQFRAAGFPIGSGGVESGVKQYKHRLCGPGMAWSRPALRRMVHLRSAVLSGTFDQLWDAA